MSENQMSFSWFIDDQEQGKYSGVGITWKPSESRNRRYIFMSKAELLWLITEAKHRMGLVAP